MPSPKTLFIVGAGASSEAELPTGNQLTKKIGSFLDIRLDRGRNSAPGDEFIIGAFRLHASQADTPGVNLNPYWQAAKQIKNAMPQAPSIDNFIDTHKGDIYIELCGKIAIVRSILDAEKNSLLYINLSNIYNRINFSRLEKTWYASFWKLLTVNCKKEELSGRLKSISLIVFNYDRCIEHFLYNSLQNYYGIPPADAEQLVNEIQIFHPYGVVGKLPWQGGDSINFGDKPDTHKLLKLAKQIKTFTEGTDPNSSEILSIRKNVSEAENIVFLGFAYHKLNMELMAPDNSDKPTTYFGTAQGISDSDCKIIENELMNYKSSSPKGVFINNKLGCVNLFEEYWRSLTLS